MKVEDLITLSPEILKAIESNPTLMKYLAEEIQSAGSLKGAVYNCLSIKGNIVCDTDGNVITTLDF